MKRFPLFPVVILLLGGSAQVFAQQDIKQYQNALRTLDRRGEVYFTFNLGAKSMAGQSAGAISNLTNVISIDAVEGNTVSAYANKKEFAEFVKLGLDYEIKTSPGELLQNPAMAATPAELALEWDKYPTYEAYVAAMYDFQTRFPAICKIIKIGTSNQGRDLLYAKISDNVNVKEAEPRHMYTSAMHGDETVMYVNFLRLIDYLLTNYATNTRIKNIVDNIEIWICPLENPDGTYYGGNATVSGARRANANNIDLNRHYPLTTEAPGLYPNKEPETRAVLALVDSLQFTISANVHGGSELLNYPYDYADVIHPDESWMLHVYRQFADTVHKVAPTIMTQQNNGVVRGFVWYQIFGSRMDYLTYHKSMREVTWEGSLTKLVSGADLPLFWNYYYRSILNLMEQNLYGVNGTVTSATTGAPLKAKVNTLSHDNAQSVFYSKLPTGDFWRPMAQGAYDIEFSAPGYVTYVERNVQVAWEKATVLNIKLTPVGTGLEPYRGLQQNDIRVISSGGTSYQIVFHGGTGKHKVSICDVSGKEVRAFPDQNQSGLTRVAWNGSDDAGRALASGLYFFRLQSGGKTLSRNIVLSR